MTDQNILKMHMPSIEPGEAPDAGNAAEMASEMASQSALLDGALADQKRYLVEIEGKIDQAEQHTKALRGEHIAASRHMERLRKTADATEYFRATLRAIEREYGEG